MPGVKLKEGESFESILRRFKKQCEKSGILSEIRKREHYEKKSIRLKKKAFAARKRSIKPKRGPRPSTSGSSFGGSGSSSGGGRS